MYGDGSRMWEAKKILKQQIIQKNVLRIYGTQFREIYWDFDKANEMKNSWIHRIIEIK